MKKEHTGQGAKGLKFKVPAAVVAIAMLAVAFAGFLPSASDGSDNSTLGAIEGAWDGVTIAAEFEFGDGTPGDPFLIYTPEELAFLANRVNAGDTDYNSASYRLAKDIYLNDESSTHPWTPIGNLSDHFEGEFDGGNHTIYGIYIELIVTPVAANDYRGLFGYVEGGTISDLTVKNYDITGRDYIGGVVGYLKDSIITNVGAEGGSIESVPTNTTNGRFVGGVVGYAVNSTITECYNTGTVKAETRVGGVVGQAYSHSTVNLCYNIGDVKGNVANGTSIGGVAGLLNDKSIAVNCFNNGTVTGWRAGGVIGQLNDSDLHNSYNWGKVIGANAAGVVGSSVAGGHILNCYNWIDPEIQDGVSIVGNFTGGGTDNCFYFVGTTKQGSIGNIDIPENNTFDGNLMTDELGDGEGLRLDKVLDDWTDTNASPVGIESYSGWMLAAHPDGGVFPVLTNLTAYVTVNIEGSGDYELDPFDATLMFPNVYAKGTTVTVIMTPDEGGELSSVFVGGVEVTPVEDDGVFTYTFTLFENTIVDVEFINIIPPPNGGPGKCLHYLLPLIIVSLILFALIFFGAKCRCKKDE